MTTQSNAVLESSFESSAVAPAVIPAGQRFYWSVRREIWENRSIYLAPLAVAAFVLIGSLVSLINLRAHAGGLSTVTPMQQVQLKYAAFKIVAVLLMLTTFIVAVFYCLDALHGERQNRSILFWKSLPVSDLVTVLSKASIPLVILPLVAFAIIVVTQILLLLMSSAVLMGTGLNGVAMGEHLPLLQGWMMLLYHLVAIHSLWYAPIYLWLLLVSAWARRAPLLWATLPLLAISVVEKIAFNTAYFFGMLRDRLSGGTEGAAFASGNMPMDSLSQISLGYFLISPGLWVGLIVAAVFLAAAVQMRRYRGPL